MRLILLSKNRKKRGRKVATSYRDLSSSLVFTKPCEVDPAGNVEEGTGAQRGEVRGAAGHSSLVVGGESEVISNNSLKSHHCTDILQHLRQGCRPNWSLRSFYGMQSSFKKLRPYLKNEIIYLNIQDLTWFHHQEFHSDSQYPELMVDYSRSRLPFSPPVLKSVSSWKTVS